MCLHRENSQYFSLEYKTQEGDFREKWKHCRQQHKTDIASGWITTSGWQRVVHRDKKQRGQSSSHSWTVWLSHASLGRLSQTVLVFQQVLKDFSAERNQLTLVLRPHWRPKPPSRCWRKRRKPTGRASAGTATGLRFRGTRGQADRQLPTLLKRCWRHRSITASSVVSKLGATC